MDKKKILILLILFVAVTGLTMSTVSAATKTTGKIYFKEQKGGYSSGKKSVGKGEFVDVFYAIKEQQGPANQMMISMSGMYSNAKYFRLDKATVKFSKKVNGKTYYSTKMFKAIKEEMPGGYSHMIIYSPKNGYRPYYAIVTYKNQ